MQPIAHDYSCDRETGSPLERLQKCREELGQNVGRLVKIRASGKVAIENLREVDQTMAAYFVQTKNPVKLLWSRIKNPGAIRRQRRLIESGIKSLRAFFTEIDQLSPIRKKGKTPTPTSLDRPSAHDLTRETILASSVAKHHVIISGTGRAGTTFLMELLTSLGLDTGYQHYAGLIDHNSQAGLERDLRLPDAPYIVKNPGLCDYLSDVIEDGNIQIDHAFVPVRELSAAARSRARVSSLPGSIGKKAWGGFWDAQDAGEQEVTLTRKLFQLMTTLTQYDIPTTLLSFPRLVEDAPYLYDKLSPVLGDISYPTFEEIFHRTARPELVMKVS